MMADKPVTVPEGKIHILHTGISFCGSVPRDWPAGDVWVDICDGHEGTCETCVKNWKEHSWKYRLDH